MSDAPSRRSPRDVSPDRVARLARLDAVIELLLGVFQALPSPDEAIDDHWTARDVIGHLVFWHESFARNVDDIAHGRVPTPLQGRMADLNDRGVAEMRALPVEEVVRRLLAAQATVREWIFTPRLGVIPYRIGSRPYTPGEHLDVVRDHVVTHLHGLDPPRRRESRPRSRDRRPPAGPG